MGTHWNRHGIFVVCTKTWLVDTNCNCINNLSMPLDIIGCKKKKNYPIRSYEYSSHLGAELSAHSEYVDNCDGNFVYDIYLNPCHVQYKLRCHTHSFQPIKILDPEYWYKFTSLMTNSADSDQLASEEACWSGSTHLQRQGISGVSMTRLNFQAS